MGDHTPAQAQKIYEPKYVPKKPYFESFEQFFSRLEKSPDLKWLFNKLKDEQSAYSGPWSEKNASELFKRMAETVGLRKDIEPVPAVPLLSLAFNLYVGEKAMPKAGQLLTDKFDFNIGGTDYSTRVELNGEQSSVTLTLKGRGITPNEIYSALQKNPKFAEKAAVPLAVALGVLSVGELRFNNKDEAEAFARDFSTVASEPGYQNSKIMVMSLIGAPNPVYFARVRDGVVFASDRKFILNEYWTSAVEQGGVDVEKLKKSPYNFPATTESIEAYRNLLEAFEVAGFVPKTMAKAFELEASKDKFGRVKAEFITNPKEYQRRVKEKADLQNALINSFPTATPEVKRSIESQIKKIWAESFTELKFGLTSRQLGDIANARKGVSLKDIDNKLRKQLGMAEINTPFEGEPVVKKEKQKEAQVVREKALVVLDKQEEIPKQKAPLVTITTPKLITDKEVQDITSKLQLKHQGAEKKEEKKPVEKVAVAEVQTLMLDSKQQKKILKLPFVNEVKEEYTKTAAFTVVTAPRTSASKGDVESFLKALGKKESVNTYIFDLTIPVKAEKDKNAEITLKFTLSPTSVRVQKK